jgi:hypothetical protein
MVMVSKIWRSTEHALYKGKVYRAISVKHKSDSRVFVALRRCSCSKHTMATAIVFFHLIDNLVISRQSKAGQFAP